MHVKIGKFCRVLMSCLIMQLSAEQVKLRVVSEDGRPIQRIAVGSPCMVEVIVPGTIAMQKRPFVAGVGRSQIVREQESMQMYIRNGVTMQERTISYLVTFSQAGTQRVGPAYIQTPTGEIVSNELMLEVYEAPAGEQQREVFAEIEFAKRRAFLHEAVPYTIRFYYTDDAASRVNMRPLSIRDCKVVQAQEVGRGTMVKNNIQYHYFEWRGIIYPQQIGQIIIPPIFFEYMEQSSRALQNQWAQFMHLMGGFVSHKQTSTKQTTLEVHALPATKETVAGVGSIKEITLAPSQYVVEQGESIICRVTVIGAADMDVLTLPPLQVDDAFRVYNSQTTVTGTYPEFTKSFEYIVQALHEGTHTIPAQRYCFFDPEREQYQLFVTPVHTIRVTASQKIVVPEDQKPEVTGEKQAAITDQAASEIIDQPLQPTKAIIPLPFFIVFCLIPVLWVCMKRPWLRWYQALQTKRRKKKMFILIRRDIRAAVEHNNPYAFLKSWNMFEQIVDPTEYLAGEALARWHQFSDKLAEAAFFNADQLQLHALAQQAEQIVRDIETALQMRR